jgi:hypothetical protein
MYPLVASVIGAELPPMETVLTAPNPVPLTTTVLPPAVGAGEAMTSEMTGTAEATEAKDERAQAEIVTSRGRFMKLVPSDSRCAVYRTRRERAKTPGVNSSKSAGFAR